MNLGKLMMVIQKHPDCLVRPPVGQPVVSTGFHRLPDDLAKFYDLCGGIELFRTAVYPYEILPPHHFRIANEVLCPNAWTETEWQEDISSGWYLVASDPDGQYLTIDLNLQRLGRCYDSFVGRHAIKGFCPIIARSFSELLESLWLNKGDYPYWLKEDFSLGDAYDDV